MSTSHATHRTDVQMRFCDTDALGHVNNARYLESLETARLDFLSVLGTTVRSLILANLHIDYRRQVELGDRIHVDSWVERLGNSSITIAHTLYANDERAADVTSVVVHFDYERGQSEPLTPEMRAALERYMAAESDLLSPAHRR